MLTILDEFYLLCINDDTGRVMASASARMDFGLSGALLSMLALQGRIQLGEKGRVSLVDASATGDSFLDEALAAMQASEHPRRITYWVKRLVSQSGDFYDTLVQRLVEKQVVSAEDGGISWVVPFAGHPELKASAKYAIKSHLRTQILAGEETALPELTLLSLMDACELLDLVFTKDERKAACRRINELVIATALRQPDVQIIQEIRSTVASLFEGD